jgi:hypothetical protein
MRSNPDVGPWLAVGAGVVIVGGAVYFLTRNSGTAGTPPSPDAAPAPTPPRQASFTVTHQSTEATYSLTATDGHAIALKVGESLAIRPPYPAGPQQAWHIEILPGGSTLTPSAGLVDHGFLADGADLIQATSFGKATISMYLYSTDMQKFGRIETNAMPVTVSA